MRIRQIVIGLRLPFLTGSLLPVWAAWALAARSQPIRLLDGLAVTLAAAFLHIGSNLLNDDCDTDGSDRINRWHSPFSGGSRVILDGTLTRRAVRLLTLAFYGAAGLIGVYFAWEGRPLVFVFGLAGLLAGILYSTTFMRRGLGELAIFLAFGPLLTLASGYALCGRLDPAQLWLGVVPGWLITAVLWINEFPDAEADAAVGKRQLVVRLGKRRARWIYLALMLLPFVSVAVLASGGVLPVGCLIVALALPLVLTATRAFQRTWGDPARIVGAQALTIQSHLAVGALLALALLLT